MPRYRFILNSAEPGVERTEEYGVFNDEGALRFARRFGDGRAVDVWESERLVGRVEPGPPVVAAD